MVKIRFVAQGANSMIGGFSTGDVAAVGEAIAKHLVDEARVAEYVKVPAPEKPAKGRAKSAVPPAPTSATKE